MDRRRWIIAALVVMALLVFAAKPFNEVHIANFDELVEELKEITLQVAGTVSIDSSDEEPVVVRAVDEAAPKPFQGEISSSFAAQGLSQFVNPANLGIPEGAFVTIEHVSAVVTVPEGHALNLATITTRMDDDCSERIAHPVVFGFSGPGRNIGEGENFVRYSASHELLAFHNADCSMGLNVQREDPGGTVTVRVILSGHYVEQQQ